MSLFIKTERFTIDPHHGSGTKIVLPFNRLTRRSSFTQSQKFRAPAERPSYEIGAPAGRPAKRQERPKGEFVSTHRPFVDPPRDRYKLSPKPWLIKSPDTIVDNYVIFEYM